jgi:UDPglucose--hexose-1-phosphate uridylyltransferase
MPPKMAMERGALARECALCRVAPEEARGPRFLLRRGAWVAFAPRASRKPFEAWVVPERHLPSLREVEGSNLRDLALLTRDLLARMEGVLGDFPYNAMLFQLGEGDYHLSLRVEPELATAAGFEKNTGVYINPLPPEEAARALRGAPR